MSKKDGHYYDCDSSLLIPSGLTSVAGTERYFFVAPIVTDERFGVDLLQIYGTPTKGTKEGGMSTRSNSTEASDTKSPEGVGSGVSSLTASNASQDVLTTLIGAVSTSDLRAQDRDDVINLMWQLNADKNKKAAMVAARDKDISDLRACLQTQALEIKKLEGRLQVLRSSGLNGHHLTSAQWHKENPEACKQYFLFPTFDEMKVYLGAFWPTYFG